MLGVPRSRNFSYETFHVMSRVGFHSRLRRAALWSWESYFGPACTNVLGSSGRKAIGLAGLAALNAAITGAAAACWSASEIVGGFW